MYLMPLEASVVTFSSHNSGIFLNGKFRVYIFIRLLSENCMDRLFLLLEGMRCPMMEVGFLECCWIKDFQRTPQENEM